MKVQLGARVSRSTRDACRQAADRAGISLNQWVEDALVAALGPHMRGGDPQPEPSGPRTEATPSPAPAPPPTRLPLPGLRP